MKNLILILALIAFVTGGYASNVFPASPDVNCVDCLEIILFLTPYLLFIVLR